MSAVRNEHSAANDGIASSRPVAASASPASNSRAPGWLLAAVRTPAAGLGAWLGLCLLLIVLMHRWTGHWLLAIVLGTCLQSLALALLLRHAWRRIREPSPRLPPG